MVQSTCLKTRFLVSYISGYKYKILFMLCCLARLWKLHRGYLNSSERKRYESNVKIYCDKQLQIEINDKGKVTLGILKF